jgi:hypothetical protein
MFNFGRISKSYLTKRFDPDFSFSEMAIEIRFYNKKLLPTKNKSQKKNIRSNSEWKKESDRE